MSIRLWHDDVRPPPEGWVWARTNAEAQEILSAGGVVEASLDHDLGYHDVDIPEDPDEAIEVLSLRGVSEETGYDLVEWMIEHDLVPEFVTVHSWNPDGAKRMVARMERCGHACVYTPYVVPGVTYE